MRKDNPAVLIDAGYLNNISKHLGNGRYLKTKIQSLAINLSKELGKYMWCEDIFYYDAPPFQSHNPTIDEIKRKQGYDIMISKLRKGMPKTWVREGRLQRIDGKFRQKGVDAWIVFDLLRIAQQKNHETIILLTADTDFVPIIKELRELYDTKIVLAYFTEKVRNSSFSLSNELWGLFNEKILITKGHFFVPESKRKE